jgi:hypothetical protein
MSDEVAPPAVALAALRCFSHEPNYEAILGDLNEEFHRRLMQSGILAARLWYMRDTVRSIWSMTCRVLRQKPLRLIAFAVACLVVMNAVTVGYVLSVVPRPSLMLTSPQWWTLLTLQCVMPMLFGWWGGWLLPRREWPLALMYTAIYIAFAIAGVLFIIRTIPINVVMPMIQPFRSLAAYGNGFRFLMFWLGCVIASRNRAEPRPTTKGAAVVGCVLLVLLGPAVLQAQATNGGRWIGAWTLNVPQSTFGVPLAPRIPPGFMVVSQTLTIEQTAQQLRLFGETVYSDAAGSHTAMDDSQLSLDGTPTRRGPISLTFRLMDNSTFDIVSEATLGARTLSEVSHFSVSADGQTLTETKTQTERSPGAATDTPGGTGRRSTSVLIFGRRAN